MEDHDLETAGLDSESGLKMGDLLDQKLPPTTLASRDAPRYTPPPFFEKNFLSGTDNGRVSRFRAESGLGSDGKKTGNLERLPNEL